MQKPDMVQTIMTDFSERSCISGIGCIPVRYLWTDAFAVCNFLELFRRTGEQRYIKEALLLVDQVHHVLGQHRSDDPRSGWISCLDNREGELHPTIGGLRIGKKNNERKSDAPYNDRLEWEQDGQYFHYLTKWMHALNRVSEVSGKRIYNQWAIELAKVAYAGFSYAVPGTGVKRLYWKMSNDLSRPLVKSMGQHDPLDGYITCLQLEATAKTFAETPAELSLSTEIEELAVMCAGANWATEDPLGIGGLLGDAYRLVQLINSFHLQQTATLQSLLHDAELSLQAFASNNPLDFTADYRLAFRELGLAIGLHAISRMQKTIEQYPENFSNTHKLHSMLSSLAGFQHISEIIESFWLKSEHRSAGSWQDHADINNVMLATSLAPEAYL